MPIIQQKNHYFLLAKDLDDTQLSHRLSPTFWQQENRILGSAKGRGITYFLFTQDIWGVNTALRHYYRGGLFGKINRDIYAFTGLEHTRSIKEFRLLQYLHQANIAVPKPILAHVERLPFRRYRANLITERIENAQDLTAILRTQPLPPSTWQQIGKLISSLHHAQINHTDLNAHNILLQAQGTEREKAYLIDFDKCREEQGENWKAENLARLKRSFLKEVRKIGIDFNEEDWQALVAGYSE